MKKFLIIFILINILFLSCSTNTRDCENPEGLYLNGYVSTSCLSEQPEIGVSLDYIETGNIISNYKVLKLFQSNDLITSYNLNYKFSYTSDSKKEDVYMINHYCLDISSESDFEYLVMAFCTNDIYCTIGDSIKEDNVNIKALRNTVKCLNNFKKLNNFNVKPY